MKIKSPIITWYDVRTGKKGKGDEEIVEVSYGFVRGRLCFQIRPNGRSAQDAVETELRDPVTHKVVLDPVTQKAKLVVKRFLAHNLFSNLPNGCDTVEQGKDSAFEEMCGMTGTKQHSLFWDIPMPDHAFRLHPMSKRAA